MTPKVEPSIAVDARYLRRSHVGISVYLQDLIRELSAECPVTLLANSEGLGAKLRHDLPACEVVVLPELREAVWEQRSLPRFLHHMRPSAYIAGANRGLPLRSPRRTRLALVLHDLIPLRNPRFIMRHLDWAPRYLFGTAVSIAKADLIIANSHSTSRDVLRLRPSASVAVRYPSSPRPPQQASPLPADWPDDFLVYCGGADGRKNVAQLVEAHAGYRASGGRLPLIVLGPHHDPKLVEQEDRHALNEVLWPGEVDDATKWAALARARALVYPSSWEGFGLPILEALAVKTPVLAGIGGAQREVGGDAVICVDGRDPESIRAGLDQVLDPQWQAQLPARAAQQLKRIEDRRLNATQLLEQLLS